MIEKKEIYIRVKEKDLWTKRQREKDRERKTDNLSINRKVSGKEGKECLL